MKIKNIFIVLLSLLLLAGCGSESPQPLVTGSAPIVIAGAETGFAGSVPLSDYEAPERFTGEWTGLEGCLLVTADAKVVLPAVEDMPIASIGRSEFTQADADKLLEVFLKGNTLYEERGMTKAEIGQKLESYKAMQRGEIPLALDGERTAAELPEVIERWQQYYDEAPEDSELIPAAAEFQAGDYWSEISGFAQVEGEKLHAVIENSNDRNEALFWLDGYGGRNGINATPASFMDEPWEIAITEEEALEMGTGLMEELGLDVVCGLIEPVVYSVDYSGIGYHMEFVRTVNGVPISYSELPGTAVEDGDSGRLWGYERISVYAGVDGIVYFCWENPHTEPLVQSTGTKLMAFEDISGIFAKMIMIKNNDIQIANGKNGFDVIHSMDVDRVELNLMRLRDKGEYEKGLVIPVWDFKATTSARAADESYSHLVYDGSRYETVLTLNAIDGTVIDRELGY